MDKIYLNNLGAEASSSGDFEKAEKYFRQAFELSPDDPLVCFNIGFVLLKKGNKEESIRWFDSALMNADTPSSDVPDAGVGAGTEKTGTPAGKLALDCGLACFEQGMYEKAEYYYQRASSSEKNSGEYWNRLGVLRFVTEKHDKARDCFEKAVSIDKQHLDAWYNLADTYDVLKLKDKASFARKQFLILENRKEELP